MDWINTFLAYTEGVPSPEQFRLWSAIAVVAGALERRCYCYTGRGVLFPNLYTLLVATPGMGKTVAIEHVEELWHGAKGFHISAHNVTKAALLDDLSSAGETRIVPGGLVEYHCLLVAADEFGVLVPAHDLEFLSVLNRIYSNPRNHAERRRMAGRDVDIIHPCLNIIAGAQPSFLSSLLPDEAWSMGFTSRLLMVYAGSSPDVSLFDTITLSLELKSDLISKLNAFHDLLGPFTFEPESVHLMEEWRKIKYAPIPDHSKLTHYIPRRPAHTIKLAMVSAVSRSGALIITPYDINRARDWLISIEQTMPDIFREMVGKSDSQVISDLHFYMWQRWAKDKKPIHESSLIHFLQSKVPSEKVMRVFDIAERSGIIENKGEKMWVPRPKQGFGVE